ncbi:MAG: helix-turn-helix domain-containing protein [Cytophaga sp.]|uniref:helix-turn-helix domain-containing protein n=1 Tax=Cytophaga sp. TaxID=29535 RepID=UPI003F7E00B8
MEESIVERVLVLIKDYGLTASEFADKIDVQRSSMSHLVSGRNKPSLDFIQKILNNFSDINPSWLIMGTGPMKQLDLFDIKGDVAPVEPIPAEKFRSSADIAVNEQTAIKQSFPEVEMLEEPVKVTPVQQPGAIYIEPTPVQPVTKEEPVSTQAPNQVIQQPLASPPVIPASAQETVHIQPITQPAQVAQPAAVTQANQVVNQIEKSGQNDKKVVKIVFFYSDNTFESFNPQ